MEPRISSIAPFFYLTTLNYCLMTKYVGVLLLSKYLLESSYVLVCMLYVCVEIDRGWKRFDFKTSGF